AAVALVQIDAAARAQPAAVLVAERPCRQRQQDLLADERFEIQLFAAVEAQSELAGIELPVLRRARIGREHEIQFLFERKRITFKAAAAMPLDRAGDVPLKEEIGARAVILGMHLERLRKAKVLALAVQSIELFRAFGEVELFRRLGDLGD